MFLLINYFFYSMKRLLINRSIIYFYFQGLFKPLQSPFLIFKDDACCKIKLCDQLKDILKEEIGRQFSTPLHATTHSKTCQKICFWSQQIKAQLQDRNTQLLLKQFSQALHLNSTHVLTLTLCVAHLDSLETNA